MKSVEFFLLGILLQLVNLQLHMLYITIGVVVFAFLGCLASFKRWSDEEQARVTGRVAPSDTDLDLPSR